MLLHIQIFDKIIKQEIHVATQKQLPTLYFYNPLYHEDIHVSKR
jgi:hypothetical protein